MFFATYFFYPNQILCFKSCYLIAILEVAPISNKTIFSALNFNINRTPYNFYLSKKPFCYSNKTASSFHFKNIVPWNPNAFQICGDKDFTCVNRDLRATLNEYLSWIRNLYFIIFSAEKSHDCLRRADISWWEYLKDVQNQRVALAYFLGYAQTNPTLPSSRFSPSPPLPLSISVKKPVERNWSWN